MSPDPQLLNRGKITGQAIAGGGGTYDMLGPRGTALIDCEGASTLIIEADMTGAANGDLAVQVNPYEVDQATIMPIAVPKVQDVGPTLNGGNVYYYGQFDVTGIDAVRVRLTNANVGAQTINRASWRLA